MSWGTPSGRRRRFSRPVGCLIWLMALIVLLILLSALFGGFQKGTKAGGAIAVSPAAASRGADGGWAVLRGLGTGTA